MVTTALPPLLTSRSAPPVAARRLLTGYYAGLGLVMAVWGSRMPAVQEAAQLSPGRLAVVLLSAATGMVAGLQAGGRLVHRYGAARLLAAPAIGLGWSLAALGWSSTLSSLVAAALLFGAMHGVFDVASNTAAVRCQTAYQRPIMSGLHAAYSIGGLTGAVVAALTAHAPHDAVFTGAGTLAVLGALVAIPLTPAVARLDRGAAVGAAAAAGPAAISGQRSRIWLLGAVAAGCLLGEGAAADWAAVHLYGMDSPAGVGATAYALYSAAMAVGRLAGDRLTARYDAAVLVRGGATLAAVGLGAGLVVGTVPAALLGWAALGLGLSIVVPSVFTAAGDGGPRAVATVAAVGYLGMLAGPAAIGALASVSSLPIALALPVLLAGAVACASHRALGPAR